MTSWQDHYRHLVATLLIAATKDGQFHTVHALLNEAPSDDARDRALIEAARFGHNEIARLLIRNGADVATEGPDWVFLKRNGTAIEGACGPLKLDDLIGEFRQWVDAVEPQAAAIETEWQADAED